MWNGDTGDGDPPDRCRSGVDRDGEQVVPAHQRCPRFVLAEEVQHGLRCEQWQAVCRGRFPTEVQQSRVVSHVAVRDEDPVEGRCVIAMRDEELVLHTEVWRCVEQQYHAVVRGHSDR